MLRTVSRALLSLMFVTLGVLHFTTADAFVHVMPPYLPLHLELVYLSGLFEILGGVGVQIPKLRKAAGYGLLALLIAVFPANIHMALNEVSAPDGTPIPVALLWARLPLQFVMMAWVWSVAIRKDRGAPAVAAAA
jgi:uncharacterized membrane protein